MYSIVHLKIIGFITNKKKFCGVIFRASRAWANKLTCLVVIGVQWANKLTCLIVLVALKLTLESNWIYTLEDLK